MSESKSSNPGLVVPVDVVAFCVGKPDVDASRTTNQEAFAGATIDFRHQTTGDQTKKPAYLGANIFRGLFQPPLRELEAGVHLHWAMPDALTNAPVSDVDTGPDADSPFPAVPNRWLVTRVVIDGAAPSSVTSWVVESDALNPSAPGDWRDPTVALQPGTADQDYAYIGQSTALDTYSPSALLNGPRTFKTATGAELSAVSNGVPTFAAYYPESRNVFGFVDTLSDLSAPANLMYVVTGWYDLPANDPATISTDLQASHSWKTGFSPAYTLYSGSVQDISWNVGTSYVQEDPPSIQADAAVGNVPIEALSAYFGEKFWPDSKAIFEQLLCAFQEGLLPRFTQQGPGVLATLAEALHGKEFQAVDSGQIYSIVSDIGGAEREVTNLPLAIASALNQLNVAAQAYEEVDTHRESVQWQMFADWYRYFQANTGNSSVVYNHASDLYWDSWSDQKTGVQAAWTAARDALAAQQTAVADLLNDTGFRLKATPGPRYWQPTEPSILLASNDLEFPSRYGGDGQYSDDSLLLCRSTGQIVSAVDAGGAHVDGSAFATAAVLPPAKLPYAADCTNLLIEACLLNTRMAATASGKADSDLATALQDLLQTQAQSLWTVDAGTAPSPVALAWWGPANPWLPLLLYWEVSYKPLFATDSLQNYTSDFFAANFTVDTGTGSFVRYAPGNGQGAIRLDPGSIDFPQSWTGHAILSPTSADNLKQALLRYQSTTSDTSLQRIADELGKTATLVQPLSGFTAGLLMQEQIPQLQITIPPDTKDDDLTSWTQAVVGTSYAVSPQIQWPYNPIRAGWFQVSLQAIDAFGQRRKVSLTSHAMAESMTALSGTTPVPGVAYAAPRLAQPARLLFEWISAGAGSVAEMNDHPAISPICGWLLPNHLNAGFFLYDAMGRPYGSLQIYGDPATDDKVALVWQSAPGDDATINQPIDQVLADANPAFRDFALALANKATPLWFQAFWSAIDRAQDSISPELAATDSGMAILVGRPIAVAQAALRLDLRGRTALNQSFDCVVDSEWQDTDSQFSSVTYPVLLGDADNLDDGLVGYFAAPSPGSGIDLSTFYSGGADQSTVPGVAVPKQDTVLLTPSPKFDDPEPPPTDQQTTRVLMLVEPRAPVHATTGILPTQTLRIPPDAAAAAIGTLEMSFPVTPILRSTGRLALPLPHQAGYAVSFIEQDSNGGNRQWTTIADIGKPPSRAMWDYTPQGLTEGWLRLNPTLIRFEIMNAQGQALVTGGTTQAVTLRVTNTKPVAITFQPGSLSGEDAPPQPGSCFYLHFGALVDQADVAALGINADGWTLQPLQDKTYGQYWGATPTGPVVLQPGQSIDMAIPNLKAVSTAAQAQIYADYYGVDGVSDGVFADLVTIQKSVS